MEWANTICTLLDPKLPIKPNPEEKEGDRRNSFACLIGSLQYLATATHPSIAFAVNQLSAYTADPSLSHQMAVRRILRYLAGTKDLRITYQKTQQTQSHMELLHGFADAAYANNTDYRSTSSYVFIVAGGAVMWGSRKQTSVTLSSTEAEYVALSKATQESKWLQTLYKELEFEQNYPIPLFGDNWGSFVMANNPQFHKRS